MRFRCGREQAVTQSRICADAHLRLGGSAAFQRKRAAPVFVTGWKPRESLSAPVAETIPMATAVQKITLSSSRDKRALFVGLDAYEQAGGIVMRDLFQQDDGGWLENVALLDGLVAEKLKAEAEKIAAEGWKWIEVNVDFPFGHTHRLRHRLEAT